MPNTKKHKSNFDNEIEIENVSEVAEEPVSEATADFNDISNFVDLDNYLKKLTVDQTNVQSLLTAALEKNPKFFTHVYHYLTEKKRFNIEDNQLPPIPTINADDGALQANKKLEQAVEIFRIQQERIEKKGRKTLDNFIQEQKKQGYNPNIYTINNVKGQTEKALKESGERIAQDRIFQSQYINETTRNFYRAQALNGTSLVGEQSFSTDIYYVKSDSIDKVTNLNVIMTALQNDVCESNPPNGCSLRIVIDKGADVKNIRENQIHSWEGWYFNSRKESGGFGHDEVEYDVQDNFPIENTKHENPIHSKVKYDQINQIQNDIIKQIEERIKSLKSSFFYTSAAKAKAAAFEDLVKLIRSKSETQSLHELISLWEKGGSGSYANKKVVGDEKTEPAPNGGTVTTRPVSCKKGQEISVSALMKQTRSLFGDKESDETKSMKLIEQIKGLAADVVKKAGIEPTVQANHQLSNKKD